MNFTGHRTILRSVPQDRHHLPRLRRTPRRRTDFGYSAGEAAVILGMSGVDVLRAIREGQLRVGTHRNIRGRDAWGSYEGKRRFTRECDLHDRVISQAALDEFRDHHAAHVAAAAGE